MKKQKGPIAIRYTGLIFGLALVCGYVFAQNPAQTAFTTGTAARKVSQIDTSINREVQNPFPVTVFSPQGVDISLDNNDLVVTSSQCGPSSNSCVTRIPVSTGNPQSIATRNGALFVAITPPISNRGGCRFAYVTTASANISEINLCDNSVRQPNIMIPGGVSSLGVAVAPLPDGTADIWTSDLAVSGRVIVFNTTIRTDCPPPNQGQCVPGCKFIQQPPSCVPAIFAVDLTCPPDCINT
ncbi:MAG: hypothetical protein HYR55_01330 [Acidobacteria bacterium]|nr:hypothetical protein [Acidobacteriota bacterium]MBI3655249.1 hypothetical protein [Acidobacteriota bacterium]